MKHCHPCGVPAPPPPPPMENCCGGSYLMQRILAGGRLIRRPCWVTPCPDGFPRCAQGPWTVTEAGVCGAVQWQEIPSRRRGGLTLLIHVPLTLRLRDRCGACFSVDAAAEEELFLRFRCPENEGWRGQIFVQAAARPYRACACQRETDLCRLPVELLAEGFLLIPCAVGCREQPPCPEPRSLYPRSPFEICGE